MRSIAAKPGIGSTETLRNWVRHAEIDGGHAGDPLYGIRRLLLTGEERLTDRARERIRAALAAGDPDDEVWYAWQPYRSSVKAAAPCTRGRCAWQA
jgi:hypothetical protein